MEMVSEMVKTPSVRSIKLKLLALLACCVVAGVNRMSAQTTNVYVDPSANWVGYINDWATTNMPITGGPFAGGAFPIGQLDAGFAGAVASFAPSTQADTIPSSDPSYPNYWNPDGSPNSIIDANFYVEDNNLAGQTVTFSGYVWTNTLVDPYSNNVVAFIKDFDTSYNLISVTNINLTNSGFFTLTMSINSGDHGQYGFEMQGPPQHATNESAAGSIIISSNTPPAGPVVTSITPGPISVLVTSNTTITAAATGSGLTYQWQKGGVNLVNNSSYSGVTTPTLTLSNIQGSAEGTYTVQVTDSAMRNANAKTFVLVFDPNNLSFDPNAGFSGFINCWVNSGGVQGGYDAGFGYPLNILIAGMNNGIAYMQPNTSLYAGNEANSFWVNQTDGSPGQWIEQDFYIANDILAGQGFTLTFSGYCPSNSIPAPYVESAWVEEFNSGYGLIGSVTTNLVAGQAFSITLPTGAVAGNHIQYGLRVFGLDNSPTNTDTATAVLVGPPQPTLTATVSGKTVNLSFGPTEVGHNYVVQSTTSLSAPTWQTVTTLPGIDAAQTATDTAGQTKFYRVQVQ